MNRTDFTIARPQESLLAANRVINPTLAPPSTKVSPLRRHCRITCRVPGS